MTTTATRPTTSDRPAGSRPTAPVGGGIRIDPIRVLRQNQWKLVIAVLLGAAVGVGAKLLSDEVYPLYQGSVVFELRASLRDPQASLTTDDRPDEAVERLATTESSRLVSRSILETAMRSRDIETTEWSKGFRDPSGQFVVEDAVDELEDDLSAGHRRRTQYFALTWSTHEAKDVPVVLNRIAETYLADRKSRDDERFAANLSIFNKQLQTTDTDLSSVGLEIAQFIRDKNITSADGVATDINQALEDIARRIGETKGMLSVAQSSKSQTEAKLEGRLEPSSEDIRKAEEDPVLIRANTSLRDLRVGAEIAKSKFGPNHTEYRNAERTVQAAEMERDAALKSIVERNLTADFKDYSDRAESMASLLKQYQDDQQRLETRLKEFAADRSELEQKQDRRLRLQEQRSKILDVIADLNALKVREDARSVTIAQKATTPREKSFPRWSVMVPLGAMLGLLLVAGIAFLREVLDQRVRYASDLSGMPAKLLGVVPDLEDDPTGIKRVANAIREAPQSVIAETLRQAASQIQKQIRSSGARTILAVGAMPSSGVTTILTNVAESFASAGHRVLVIDANLRRPGLAAALGIDPAKPGLGEILAGKSSIEQCVAQVTERIHFLNVGSAEHRVFERLATPGTDALLQSARSLYDVVLIDAPPAIVAGDAIVLAGKVDATFLVVRAFQEQRGLVARLVSQLHDMPSQFLGIILNRPRNTAGGYFRKNFEAMASYASNPK